MKKLQIALLLLLMIFSVQLHAQTNTDTDLMKTIVGKWKVIKYQSKNGTFAKTDLLVFESDGTFKSDSVYFGAKTGFYRTDENRGVLILENDGRTTEWKATLKKGVLRMRSAPGSKQPRIYITSVRVQEG